ncbi:MAG: DUF262 domain-containing protein, partial [Clostridia bacterium]|nr:DUF262 domain-containing protein [Clostridia bacterium]
MTVENNKIIKMTFWELISSNDVKGILIPIIQRDYAQGREGKDFIRKNLLEQLMEALDPTKGKSEEPTELDFVYGTEKDGYILPLDGQQRLTTLWLFYWFVAYKSDNLKKNKDIFKKFSYETRTSAREFCEKLCELVSMESDNKTNEPKNISEHIKNQPWFYSVWSQDPTVDSMLRMISGEKDKDNDCIEKVVKKFKKEEKDREREYFDKFWKNLTINDCPIKFNFLKISSDKIRESDDLYIKMNARGKPLTDFENFKADFIDDIKDLKSNDEAVNFASLLDNLWTDVFWENRTINGKIDEIFFTFLNRFFLNYGIVNCELNEESEE